MMRRKSTSLALMAFLAIPLLGACDSDPTGPTATSRTGNPAPVRFEVGVVKMELGQTLDLSSLLKWNPRTPQEDLAEADWISSDEDTVRVDSGGGVLALEVGVALVTLEYGGEKVSIFVEVVDEAGG